MAIIFGTLLAGAKLWPSHFANKRQHANEYAAIKTIQSINQAQVSYAAKEGGFTCNIALLAEGTSKANYLSHLENGQRNGYVFTLRSCDPGLKNQKYQLVAVPQQRDASLMGFSTGFAAFCSDESGLIYVDANGSGDDCLKRKKAAT
jgi:hypothetical protein